MNDLLKKAAAFVLSGTLLMTSAHFTVPSEMLTDAAVNKSRVSVHDPSVVKDGSTYYVFGSHIEAAKTTDLQNWTRFSNGYARTNNVEFGDLSRNLQKAFAWCGEDLEDCEGGFAVWAPDVVWNPEFRNADGTKGAYVMYFCTSSTYIRSVICFATSKNIEGPYTFGDTLIYSGFTKNDQYVKSSTKNVNKKYTSTNVDELIASGEVTMNNSWFRGNDFNNQLFPNAIDPTIYTDTNGKMYMTYGSWSGGIFTIEIDPTTGRCIHPKTGTTADGRMVDSYFGTKIAGGFGKSGEGPFIEYNADTGYYYLWTTYGGLTAKGGYNMRVSRSESPTGPFTDTAGNAAVLATSSGIDGIGLKVMGNYKFSSLDTAYMACGHNSVLRDDDGKWYLFYHSRFNSGTEYHEVRVHEMFFNEDGWPVITPFEFSGDHISESGYNETDIAGEYEYINHGNSTDGNVINYQSIKLNADHTISGAVTGSWEQAPDSAAAAITIGGQRYSGYFIAAENEKGTKVMSFTAVGSNNQTVWGAQNKAFTGNAREAGIPDYTDTNAQMIIAADTLGNASGSHYLSGTSFISGIPYYITNKNSGLSLDLPNGKLDAGTNIQQWDFNKSWAQQWRLVAVDDEYFRIVSMGDEGKCIAVAEDSAADGINVELQEYTGADNQLFRLVKSGSYYGIVSKCSGGSGALDVFEWSKENGGNVNQYAYHEYACQLWRIEPVRPGITTGTYAIRDIESGGYISLGSKFRLEVTEKPDSWEVFKQGDGTYLLGRDMKGIIPVNPVYVAVEEESSENGAAVAYMSVLSSEGAKMKIIANKDGTYSFLTAPSDYKSCFRTSENGIVQWEYSGVTSEKFVLEPIKKDAGKIRGDVNADGDLNIADVVMMQKYLTGSNDLIDWEAGDLSENGRIDIFDLIMLRRLLFR